MRHPLTFLKALTLASLVLLGDASAFAQHFEQGLKDPRIISPAGLGPSYSGLTGAGVGLVSKKPLFGVAAGDFIIQPRLFLEGSYNSNFFRVDTRNASPEGALTLHVRPGVALDGLTDAAFDALPLDDQKRVLIDCLDANHLYVNYGDMADEAYGIADQDMQVNRAFYGDKA